MISDAELRIAATEAAKALVAAAEALEDDGQPLPTPKWERRLPLWEIQQSFRRAAAAVLVLLLGCGSWLTVDTEAREDFTSWVRGVYDTYVTYRNSEHTEETPLPDKNQHYRLGWIPEGYAEVRRSERKNMVMTTYADREGRYLSFDYCNGGDQSIFMLGETDLMQHSNILIGGCLADLWVSTDPAVSSSLVWSDDAGALFQVSGFLKVDELIRIAESIEIQ